MIDIAVEGLVHSEDELRQAAAPSIPVDQSSTSLNDCVRPEKNRSQSARPPTARATSRMPKKGMGTDKKDRAQRQESSQRAAAEVGDACCQRPALEPGFDRFLEDMKSHQHDCEQEGVPEDDEHPRLLPKSRLEIERLGDQDHLAEHEGVDDGERLLPDADPVVFEGSFADRS